jgi:glycosyltransferase involved in cell wall biosynthesis
MPRLRIGFLSSQDASDRTAWSGILFNLHRALQQYAGEVETLDSPSESHFIRGILRAMSPATSFFGQNLGMMQSVPLSMAYGRFYRKKISATQCDVIVAPVASNEIGYLKTSVPVIYLSDATFTVMENYYFETAHVSRFYVWQGNHLEKRAIQNATAALYCSEWAANSAVRNYDAPAGKVHVIPFGANIDSIPPRDALRQGSTDGKCRLLFVGRGWRRKGGQLAVDALLALRARNVDAELTIVGCNPPEPINHPHVTIIPRLNQNLPEERLALQELYYKADFFVLPTRAECWGIVFCEASAYGLPIVATDTGGVPTAVQQNINGVLLPPSADGQAYADEIFAIWSDPARYQRLRRTSRERYESVLNWEAWGQSVRVLLENIVAKAQS